MQVIFRVQFERRIEHKDKRYMAWKRKGKNIYIHEVI